MAFSAAELADRIGAQVEGDGRVQISGLAGIGEARKGDITFVANRRYIAQAAETKASAIIVETAWSTPCPATLIKVDNPDKAFAVIAELFAPALIPVRPGIHPQAVVSEEAVLGKDVSVGPFSVIEAGAVIGDHTCISAQCYIGHNVKVGSNTHLYPQVSIRESCEIGSRVILHNGAVIGSDGFGYSVNDHGVRTKITQIGIVLIEDDVEIGANTTIDRARFGRTRIGKGAKIDNLVMVAHNVQVGEHSVLVSQCGVAGSSVVGNRAILAGQAGVAGHLHIGEGAIVGAQAGVTKDVAPKTYVSGYPAAPHDKASRIHAHLMRLPDLKKRVNLLETKVNSLVEKFNT